MTLHGRISSSGVHVLYEPEKSESALVDVVFVHGLGGHPRRSWQHDEIPAPDHHAKTGANTRDGSWKLLLKRSRSSDKKHQSSIRATMMRNNTWHTVSNRRPPPFWPRDLLSLACPEARIMTWGYDTLHNGDMPITAQPNIFTHVNELLPELTSLRRGAGIQERPLIFIAHSLGGMIIKEVLRQAEFSDIKSEQDIIRSTAAVIFFGCPHRTPERKPLTDTVVSMAEACLRIKVDGAVLPSLCGVDDGRWSEAQASFIRLWHHFNFVVKTYHEVLIAGNESMHRIQSSKLGDARENAEGLLAGHRTMCHFRSVNDAGFKSLSKIIRDIVSDEKLKRHGPSINELTCLRQLIYDRVRHHPSPTTEAYLGACRQICSTREFRDWYRRKDSSSKKIFWLTGSPGSGKSTVVRQVWHQLEKQWNPATTSMIYCAAQGISSMQAFAPESMLGSMPCVTTIRTLLSQLFAQDSDLRQKLLNICDSSVGDVELTRFFTDGYNTGKPRIITRRTFVLVDADNSCDDMRIHELLYCLCQIARNWDVSVYLASRAVSGRVPTNIARVALEDYNSEDMARSIQPYLMDCLEQRLVIVERVVEKARGNFVWAELATSILNQLIGRGRVQGRIDKVLQQLPMDLHELFEWALGTLSAKEKADAAAIMRWVMLSSKPMMLNDLQTAVRLSRTNFLLCCNPHRALDIGMPWSMQELQKTGRQFDTPSQFYQWLCSRTCGLLVAQPAEEKHTTQQSFGLQHIYPVHDSIKSFFLSGRGFAALSSEEATAAYPDHEAVDLCHYSLLHIILIYLNTSDLSPLVSGHHLPHQKRNPSSAGASPAWQKNVADQRDLIMSSYPFLRYAVENLLYHLLSPQHVRYFLPLKAIFNMFVADGCRIWRRWTALLGETDASAVLTRCTSAKMLLRPEFGASFRLERVFRAVNKMAMVNTRRSSRKSLETPASLGLLVPQKSEQDVVSHQKLGQVANPATLSILAPATRRRGPRSRGTVIVPGKKQGDHR